MKSTREKILKTLLTHPESSINDLAEAVGINGISIRHHLSALDAEDLIISSEQRHGVGRPRLIYSLTDKGVEQFPTSYLKLTKRLLTKLKDILTQEELEEVFQEIGRQMATQYGSNNESLPIDKRLESIQAILAKEGYIARWDEKNGTYQLTLLSCPYFHIGLEHPEVCKLDQALISSFISRNVEFKACILKDDNQCIYEIQPNIGKESDHE